MLGAASLPGAPPIARHRLAGATEQQADGGTAGDWLAVRSEFVSSLNAKPFAVPAEGGRPVEPRNWHLCQHCAGGLNLER